MTVLTFLLALLVVAVILWATWSYIPAAYNIIKLVITVIVIVVLFALLFDLIGWVNILNKPIR